MNIDTLVNRNAPRLEDVSEVENSNGEVSLDTIAMNHSFWINDLLFAVPPENISSQGGDTLWRWQALRTANTTKVHSGRGLQTYTISLSVPSKKAILNVDLRPTEADVISVGDNTGKRGGILDLILQFKNIPFARVENAFIRSDLGVPVDKNIAMCMQQMNINTMPGEPNTLNVTLTMFVFNYSPYASNWLFKDDWLTRDWFGSYRFDDVNTINLPGRDRYKLVTSRLAADELTSHPDRLGEYEEQNQVSLGDPTSIDRNLISPFIRDNGDPSNPIAPVEFNINMTESDNGRWGVEQHFMKPPIPVRSPSWSAVYKDYIDWLHSEMTSKRDADSGVQGHDFTTISPYNGEYQNLGSEVVFTWREYVKRPMSADLASSIRSFIRERALDMAAGIRDQSGYQPSTVTQTNHSTVYGYTVDAALFDNRFPFRQFDGDMGLWANLIPYGISNERRDLLLVALGELGVEEERAQAVNPGTGESEAVRLNWSFGISRYRTSNDQEWLSGEAYYDEANDFFNYVRRGILPSDGRWWNTGAWCAYFSRWVYRTSSRHGLINSSLYRTFDFSGSSSQNVENATAQGVDRFFPTGSYIPRPGDVAIVGDIGDDEYSHTCIVVRVSHDGQRVLTVDGNSSQQVRLVNRSIFEYAGFINLIDDAQYPMTFNSGIPSDDDFKSHDDDRVQSWVSGRSEQDRRTYITSVFDPTAGASSDIDSFTSEVTEGAVEFVQTDRYDAVNIVDVGENLAAVAPPTSAPATTPQAPADPTLIDEEELQEEQIEEIFEETTHSLTEYERYIREAGAEGWTLYDRDLSMYDTFYRSHELRVAADYTALPSKGAPFLCTNISLQLGNIFRQIPLNGSPLPTAQYLGKKDDQFLLSFEAIGLNSIKRISNIRDMLRRQSILFRGIPDSWVVRVENNLMNATGNRFYALNSVDYATVVDSPGTYKAEIRLEANPIDRTPPRISFVGPTNNDHILQSWVNDLLGNGDPELSFLEIQKYNSLSQDVVPIDDLAAEVRDPTNFYYVVPNENRISQLNFSTDNSANENEFRSWLRHICGALNLINHHFVKWNLFSLLSQEDGEGLQTLAWNQIPSHPLDITGLSFFGFAGELGGPSYIFRNRTPTSTSYATEEASSVENADNLQEVGLSPFTNLRNVVKDVETESNRSGAAVLKYNAAVVAVEEDVMSLFGPDMPVSTLGDWSLSSIDAGLQLSGLETHDFDAIVSGASGGFGSARGDAESSRRPFPYVNPYLRWHRSAYAVARTVNAVCSVFNPLSSWMYTVNTSKAISRDLSRRRFYENHEGHSVRRVNYNSSQGNEDISDVTYLTREYNNINVRPGLFYGHVTEFINGAADAERFMYTPTTSFDRGVLRDERALNRNKEMSPYFAFQEGSVEEETHRQNLTTQFRRLLFGELATGVHSLEEYLINHQCKAYLINMLPPMSAVIDISSFQDNNGVNVFQAAQVGIQRDRVTNTGPAYADLTLPLHPYWNNQALGPAGDWSEIFTDPDFYIFNSGTDGNEEAVQVEANEHDDTAYNRLTQSESELAIHSLELMKPLANSNNRFSTLFNAPNLYEGASAGFNFEFGLNANWLPGQAAPNLVQVLAGVAQTTVGNQMHDEHATDEEDVPILGGLRNSGIKNVNLNPKHNPWGAEDDSANEGNGPLGDLGRFFGFGNAEESQSVNLRDHTSFGMVGLGNVVDWTDINTILPSFGSNPDLTSVPPDIDRQYVGDTRNWLGRNQITSQEIMSELSQGSDAVPYDFRVDIPDGDSSSDFLSGNWGYSDMSQWSNNRIALYGKVRDALRSIGTKKWVARRAFPTFKIFFIEEDILDLNGDHAPWIIYDDVYTYNQVESIQISDSRKRPASVATISFLNIGGVLDGNNMWHTIQRDESGDSTERREALYRQQNAEGTLGQGEGTAMEQNAASFILEQGTKIKVSMGYSNNANRLKDMFIGEITEVQFSEGGNKVTVIAQSYGTELVATAKGTSVREVKKSYVNTFDLLGHMMFEPEVVHFGRFARNAVSMTSENQSLASNEIIYRNTFGHRAGRSVVRNVGATLLNLGTNTRIVRSAFGALAGQDADDIATHTDQYGQVTHGSISSAYATFKEFVNDSAVQVRGNPKAGPQDDNIYAPNFSRNQIYKWGLFNRWQRVQVPGQIAYQIPSEGAGASSTPNTFAGLNIGSTDYKYIQKFKRSEIEYNIFYSTIWDLFDEMTLRHPGYVKHPRVYGNSTRMTMFFGLPDQRYWSKRPSVGDALRANSIYEDMLSEGRSVGDNFQVRTADVHEWMQHVQRRFRPFRDWHHVNSTTDIVSNNIIANKYGFYTSVAVQYIGGKSIRNLKKAIRNIRDDENSEFLNPNGFVKFKDKHVEEMLAHRDLSPENQRQQFHEFPNCRGKIMAKRYGRALLARYAKDMYKGSVLILGNENIKPYDVVVLNDTYNDLAGPIEVEEVIHMFTPQTGYLTEIIPDTFVIQEDISPFVIWNGIRPTVMMKTERYMEDALFSYSHTRPSSDVLNNLAYNLTRQREQELREVDNIRQLFGDLSASAPGAGATIASVGGAALIGGATVLTGGLAIAAGAVVLGASSAILAMGSHFIMNYVANQRAFIMVPLIRAGRPWVSGYDLTSTNTWYRSTFDRIRRWWEDGSAGLSMMTNDGLMNNRRIRSTYGDELTWLAGARLNLSDLNYNTRRWLNDAVSGGN